MLLEPGIRLFDTDDNDNARESDHVIVSIELPFSDLQLHCMAWHEFIFMNKCRCVFSHVLQTRILHQ